MRLLADNEIRSIRVEAGSPLAVHIDFARAIEAAVLAKLGEPVAWLTDDGRVCVAETKHTAMHARVAAFFDTPLYKLRKGL